MFLHFHVKVEKGADWFVKDFDVLINALSA